MRASVVAKGGESTEAAPRPAATAHRANRAACEEPSSAAGRQAPSSFDMLPSWPALRRARLPALLLIAAVLWLPTLHLFYDVSPIERRAMAERLAQREANAALDSSQDLAAPMRGVNPEWDFMQRTFTVLTLANQALGTSGQDQAHLLAAIDAIVDRTLAEVDVGRGDAHFMLPYAKSGSFVDTSPDTRSLFIDGEIVAMIGARDMVEPRAATRAVALARADRIERAMRRSPSLSGESYPNECWTFCNTTALAGLVMLDRSEGTDHSALVRAWVDHAKAHLVDPTTGILISSYTYDGTVKDGPEGSSIWMSASNLLLLDEDFARDQYTRARRELGDSFASFGWAREWPRGTPERPDVDSGPIVPIVHASAGSSGLAILGASAFGDEAYLRSLLASIELFGFRDPATLRYRASNAVGDAVLSYALSFGPLYRRVRSAKTIAWRAAR